MKTILIITGLLLSLYLQGQTTPPVSFEYDNDGNMTARYVVSLSRMKADTDTSSAETMAAQQKEEIPSIMMGEQKITIYPNPTSGKITLAITNLDARQKNTFFLYDSTGRLVLSSQIKSESTSIEIKGPAGMYLLDIRLGEVVSKWKIIKE
ncbi:MAG: T9SS type A sorting domain-containing protein [Bacteroidales bacterium]|jgi:hypothetical protein|nr:T9SS type A sorting domain-containing protein [Bacteroidales bacterium]